jgi:hypothetical protein
MLTQLNAPGPSSEVLDHWVSHALAQQAAHDAIAAYIR